MHTFLLPLYYNPLFMYHSHRNLRSQFLRQSILLLELCYSFLMSCYYTPFLSVTWALLILAFQNNTIALVISYSFDSQFRISSIQDQQIRMKFSCFMFFLLLHSINVSCSTHCPESLLFSLLAISRS